MTDDEAFVRRIVASPGDDLPRLVYADWLDDRGDPRAAYLRAETAAPGNAAKLAPLSAGLEPVWVARVSRPPVGICCDHVQLADPGPPLLERDLQTFEAKHRVHLPAQYQALLLNWNGGKFWPYRFPALSVDGYERSFEVHIH